MECGLVGNLFLLCFAGVFSRARNVLAGTFSKVKPQLTSLRVDCGGRLVGWCLVFLLFVFLVLRGWCRLRRSF